MSSLFDSMCYLTTEIKVPDVFQFEVLNSYFHSEPVGRLSISKVFKPAFPSCTMERTNLPEKSKTFKDTEAFAGR